jgi:ADP-ribose pyrophosphatase YjhB (NUDIX family)
LTTCDDLRFGPVTGPEVEYAASDDFHPVWVPIAELANIPVFPRCVAEYLACAGTAGSHVPWVEDDRGSWDGIAGEEPPPDVRAAVRAVIVSGYGVAAVEREVDGERFFTLPGGAQEAGERAEDAVVRDVHRELGLSVQPAAKLAVVDYRCDDKFELQTYFACGRTGGSLSSGLGAERTRTWLVGQGSHRPTWLPRHLLTSSLKPSWLAEKLPRWLEGPLPARPERFCEDHDDQGAVPP